MTAEELRLQVLQSARLDRLWHKIDYRPRLIRDFHCDSAVEHVNLVAGGNWVVVVLYNGSLQLHELGAPNPTVTLSHNLSEDESVFHLSSRLSLTNDHEDLIILQMGVRYKWVSLSLSSRAQTEVLICSDSLACVGAASATSTFITLPSSTLPPRFCSLARSPSPVPSGAAPRAASCLCTASRAEAEI